MTHRAVPQRAIAKSYFWPFSAEEIVLYWRSCGYRLMSATELRDRWAEEFLLNPMMQEVGERPTQGFKQTDKVKLAEKMAA